MISLNPEQAAALAYEGNVVVTACPGSGKTRVLTARVIRGLVELKSAGKGNSTHLHESRSRRNPVTYGPRAYRCFLFMGRNHPLVALEWVLRPYAPYCETITNGFSVADEFFAERLLEELKAEEGLSPYSEIITKIDRDGTTMHTR